MRDVEDLILKTLVVVLAGDTGIPSGRIYLKKPSVEFVSKHDGVNSSGVVTEFPSIGISYFKDAQFNYNNYGEGYVVDNGDGTSTEYGPLGEIYLFLGINLFTASKKDQRDYGTKLYMSLFQRKFGFILNDPIPGEVYSLELLNKREFNDRNPVQSVYSVKVHGRILKETTGFTVDVVDVGVGIEPATGNADTIEVIPYFSTTATGTVWN